MLKLKKTETITASVLDEKRSNVLRFAAQRAIALDRHAVEALTLDQIAGLGDAAREGQLPAFVEAARALGLEVGQDQQAPPVSQVVPQQTSPSAAPAEAAQPHPEQAPPDRSREAAPRTPTPSEGAPHRGRRINFET
jgi:hypothetical protein